MKNPEIPKHVQILIKGREFLTLGHCKNRLFDGSLFRPTAVCLNGALYCASYALFGGWNQFLEEDAQDALIRQLGDQLPSSAISRAVAWNNAPERTQQDLLDLFDNTIAAELSKTEA